MRIGIVILLLGCVLLIQGTIRGGGWWFSAWLGINFIFLGIAHARGWHHVLGKRSSGVIPWWSRLVFLPYYLLTHFVWWLFRWLNKDPAINDVTDDIAIGRRLFSSEVVVPYANFVDLTAEFTEPSALRQLPGYICVPALDGGAPSAEAIREGLRRLQPGRTFVHCAQGYGRSYLFVLGLLLQTGKATSLEDAIAMVKAVRPRVRLSKPQLACARLLAASLLRSAD